MNDIALYAETVIAAMTSEEKPAKYVVEVIAENGEKLDMLGAGACFINLTTARFTGATDVRETLTPALEWEVKHTNNKPMTVNVYELEPVATADVGRTITANLSDFSPMV